MNEATRPMGPPSAQTATQTGTWGRHALRFKVQQLALLGFLLFLMAGFTALSPFFLTMRNLINVLFSVAVIGTMAPFATLMLVSRNLDLSIGSIVGLVAVSAGMMLDAGLSAPIVIAASLLIGLCCGLANAILVVGLGIESIIVTIGSLSILRGLAYFVSGGQTSVISDDLILELGSGRVFGIPAAILLATAMFAVCRVAAVHTRVGRAIYAIGANPRASRLSGIPLGPHQFLVFSLSGISAALAALLFIGQSASATPSAGTGYELLVLTAVLLGGASLHGGEGRIGGTLLGVVIIGVLNNGMTLLGVNSYLQMVAQGGLLLAAVALDQLRRRSPA